MPERESKQTEAALGRRQWIFAVLILTGMIMVGISVMLLLRDAAPAYASDACVSLK
jgi:hypothetical protein